MEKKAKAVLSWRQIATLAIIGFTNCSLFLMPYMTSAFYDPICQALNINNTQLGVLMSIYGTVTIFAALPGGWLADRIDTKKLIMLCLISTGAMGIIAAFFMNYAVYCVLWFLFAVVGNTLFWSAGMKTIRFTGSEEEQGKAYGYYSAFNFGSNSLLNAAGLAIIAAFAATLVIGVKFVFLFFSLLCIIALVLVWRFVPSIKPTISFKDAKSAEEKSESRKANFRDVLFVLKQKEVWMFSILAFCIYSIMGVATYFTPYFGDVMGLNVASAGLIYVMTGPLSILFGPIFGTVSDWMRSTVKLITILMALTLCLLCVMLLLGGGITLTMAIIIDVLVALTGGGAYNIMFASIEETGIDRRYAGTCIGVATIIAYSPDAFMYVLFGNWLDKHGNDGYNMIFVYMAVLAAIAVVLGTVLYNTSKKRKAKTPAEALPEQG